jgi:Uma2 family endonuclease
MTTTISSLVSLESGDRLSRDEFHRRYCARPDIARAELVMGVAYVPSPTRAQEHAEPHASLALWLGTFKAGAPGVRMAVEVTVFLAGSESEVRPDLCLYRLVPEGRVRVRDDGYLEGAPDLIAEVAASSVSYDLHDKMEAYRRAGVQAYIVWRVLDKQIDWFRLVNGRYVRPRPDARGVLVSHVFPGPRLAVERMLSGDDAGVLTELTRGL